MSHIRVLICCVDDPTSDQMTEIAAFDLPAADVMTLQPQTALDDLEITTHTTGNAFLRRLFQAQWERIDAQLTEQHRQRFPPAVVHADDHETVTVASRFTQRVPALTLSRQVCQHPDTQTHVMPGNAVLPPHHGLIITRGLHLLGLFTASGAVVCIPSAPARRPRRTRIRHCPIRPCARSCPRMGASSVTPGRQRSRPCSNVTI